MALVALGLSLVFIIFWYWQTAQAMVSIWIRSQTFTHAFLVPVISTWLIWRRRAALADIPLCPSLSVVPFIALAAFAWLLGDLAAVNSVTFLALTSLLVLIVPALLGLRFASAIMFPLCYLFFAVPIGEFFLPQMMAWTADFTVFALRATGIPVYREGLDFVIPSGNWSVAEACSGVRYLIASVVVGTLYAYLSYRSIKRRVIFVIVSFLVPIVANWMRAYLIVMLGHLSGNRLAVGVDHLIYGWVFFGVVIFLMFVIGARWAEYPSAEEQFADAPVEGTQVRSDSRVWFAAAAVVVLAALPHLWRSAIERGEASQGGPLHALTLSAPQGWQVAAPLEIDWRPAFANPTAELRTEFVRGEQRVGVFIGFYRHQDYERKLVSSTNALVKSTDDHWRPLAGGTQATSIGGQSLQLRTVEIRAASGQRLTVWQWYWVNGWLTSNDYLAKAYEALSRLMGKGDDGAVIILYSPYDQAADGNAALAAFSAQGSEEIHRQLRSLSE
jgi:exosortase A